MSQRIFTVLTIDGGGIRGLMTARLLHEIEERTGKPVTELFDLVAGSSTGAILAGCLTAPKVKGSSKPRFSAKDMMDFYIDDGAKVFPPSRYRQLKHLVPGMSGFFDPAPFESILEKQLGDLTLGDSLNYLMIAGTDMKKFRPEWMANFKQKGKREDLPQKWESLKTKDAIRASASPPIVFPAKYIYSHPNKNNPEAAERHAFLDGSFFAASVSRRAYTHAKKLAPEGSRIVVVSLGTGCMEPKLTPDELNKMSMIDWVSSARGASIFNVSVEMTMRDILNDLRDDIGEDLFRFNPVVDPDDINAPSMNLTNAKSTNIEKLMIAADKAIEARDEDIDRLCELLLARHHIEQKYDHSTEAFSKLAEILNNCETSVELSKLYSQIVQYSSNLKDLKVSSKDQELYDLADCLQPLHKEQLEEIYDVRHKALVEAEVIEKKSKSFWSKFNIFARKTPKTSNDNKKKPEAPKKTGRRPQ